MELDLEKVYLARTPKRGIGTIDIDDIEVVDLASSEVLGTDVLAAFRAGDPLMLVARINQGDGGDGYYKRFRSDGSAVPWQLGQVNAQRLADDLEPISFELVDA